MPHLLEQARVYISANGGHAVIGASIGVTPVMSAEICGGHRPVTSQFASGMAPLLGVTPAQLLKEDPDAQLLARRGALS